MHRLQVILLHVYFYYEPDDGVREWGAGVDRNYGMKFKVEFFF